VVARNSPFLNQLRPDSQVAAPTRSALSMLGIAISSSAAHTRAMSFVDQNKRSGDLTVSTAASDGER